MSDQPTPETDALISVGLENADRECVTAEFARKLKRERDEARKRIERQKLEIVRLNGATNHAGGTPLKIALRERDEANEELHKQMVRYDQLFDDAEKIRIERDEARGKAERYRIEANAMMMQRDEARGALERISHASMNARHKEEDYAEWEKAVFVLLDICEERKVK